MSSTGIVSSGSASASTGSGAAQTASVLIVMALVMTVMNLRMRKPKVAIPRDAWKKLLGTKLTKSKLTLKRHDRKSLRAEVLPENFSWVNKMPGMVRPIRNQGTCGSCWAFAVCDAVAERFYLKTGGEVNCLLSVQYPIDCTGAGCDGLDLDAAFNQFASEGATTVDCLSYKAVGGQGCATACDAGQSPIPKLFTDAGYTLSGEQQIMRDIMQHGPIVSGFVVFENFFTYSGGIYTKQSGAEAGGHATRIIGWGVENGQKYWICVNMWGAQWGENGTFRYARGKDLGNIETYVRAAQPKLTEMQTEFTKNKGKTIAAPETDSGAGDGTSEGVVAPGATGPVAPQPTNTPDELRKDEESSFIEDNTKNQVIFAVAGLAVAGGLYKLSNTMK